MNPGRFLYIPEFLKRRVDVHTLNQMVSFSRSLPRAHFRLKTLTARPPVVFEWYFRCSEKFANLSVCGICLVLIASHRTIFTKLFATR